MKRKSIRKKPKIKLKLSQRQKRRKKTKLCNYLKKICSNCKNSSPKKLCLCTSKPN